MSEESHDAEGNSPAAWTAVIIMLVAFTIGTFAFWFDVPWIVFASVGILAVGPIVGWYLARAGFGVNSPRRNPQSNS